MGSDKEQSDAVSKNISPLPVLPATRILVVDDEPECLVIVSEKLLNFGYEVITATLALDALSIIQQQKNEVHLVLMGFHFLDLARSFSIKKIRESSKMPFFVMSSDDTEFFLVAALSAWGKSHSETPVVIADLKALGQFGTLKKNAEKIASEGVCGFLGNQSQKGKRKGKELLSTDEIGENTELPVPKKQRLAWTDDTEKIASEGACGFLGNQSQKGKELLSMDEIGENTELPVPKKQRLAWTDDTEKVASEGACGFLGNLSQKGKELLSTDEIGENTELPVPKKQRLAWTDDFIKRFEATSDVPEAEKERTLSYLQEEDAMPECRACILSDLQLGSHPLSRTSNSVENLIPYIDQPFVTYERDSSSNLLTDSSSSLLMHDLSPSQLVSGALSSGYDSFEFILPNKQVLPHTVSGLGKLKIYGIRGGLAGFGQVKNGTGGEISEGRVNLSSLDSSGSGNEMHHATLQVNDLQLPIPPQSQVNDMQPQVPEQLLPPAIPSPPLQVNDAQGQIPLQPLLPTTPAMILPNEGNNTSYTCSDSGSGNEMHHPKLQVHDLQLPIPLHSQVNDVQPQVPEQPLPPTIPSLPLQVNDAQGQTPPQSPLPTPAMILPNECNNTSENNAGEFDDLYDFPMGPIRFSDEDLEYWLSTM